MANRRLATNLKDIVIIGAGGFGREVLDIWQAINEQMPMLEMLGFIVDPEYGEAGEIINGKPILGGFDWLAEHDVEAICAVGTPELRRDLVDRAGGAWFCSLIHPSVIMTDWITIGQGTVIAAGCILTNQIQIGNHVHINLDCTIGHDVVIEDLVTIAPGVHVSGNVVLERGCCIGTGANIIEKCRIGAWSVIGAGATVISNIPPNTTAVGVPAKVVKC